MPKFLVPVILSFALLTSCSAPNPAVTFDDIRQHCLEAETLDMTVSVAADYGDKVYPYKLSCRFGSEGGEIVIAEPETVAGVTAVVGQDGVTLTFDGAEVYTGAILPDGLSPVDAIPVMVSAWKDGLVTETVSEPFGDVSCVSVLFRINDSVSLKTWFDSDSWLPVHAEFSSDGYTVIICDFENVIME